MGGTTEVTLRKPIPIEQEMMVENVSAQKALLKLGEELIAEGSSFELEMGEAPQVEYEQARVAAEGSPAFGEHPFPTCFVCGPLRAEGDGLRIFPGAVKTGEDFQHLYAAPWVPDDSLSDGTDKVRDEMVWAALDCPTGFAGGFPYEGKLVTGRLGAKLLSPVRVGEKCVLVSWRLGVDGRKHHAAAVLVGEGGAIHAQAKATWIKLQ